MDTFSTGSRSETKSKAGVTDRIGCIIAYSIFIILSDLYNSIEVEGGQKFNKEMCPAISDTPREALAMQYKWHATRDTLQGT